MKLQRYNQFINEGIISKGLELLNYKTVKENDNIAQKYLKMIYDNYDKHKNLMAVKIAINSGHTTLWYKISEDPYTQAGTWGGESDFIEVKITSINEAGWSSDITRARIEVEKNGKKLIGRDTETNKTIESESGIDNNAYGYLNISQSQVDKMINFFKSEYIKKYPEMREYKYFDYMRILEIDKEVKKSLDLALRSRRKKHEDDRIELKNKFKDFIEQNAKFDQEEINDYFIDLIDYIDEKPSIGIGTIIDNTFVTLTKRIDDPTASFFSKDGFFYFGKLDNIPGKFGIKPGKIYYYLEFNIPDDENDIDRTLNYIIFPKKIEKFVESEYHLSTEEIKNTNGTFKLIDIGDRNKQIQFILEQK